MSPKPSGSQAAGPTTRPPGAKRRIATALVGVLGAVGAIGVQAAVGLAVQAQTPPPCDVNVESAHDVVTVDGTYLSCDWGLA